MIQTLDSVSECVCQATWPTGNASCVHLSSLQLGNPGNGRNMVINFNITHDWNYTQKHFVYRHVSLSFHIHKGVSKNLFTDITAWMSGLSLPYYPSKLLTINIGF